ncbi:MAG: T9SS type A sorting domain-containing protein [Cyclobacteriaceae bacterium]|nr:T9SS type A sorting domain-containing protein [Cyclobacteriaceae bacterium]
MKRLLHACTAFWLVCSWQLLRAQSEPANHVTSFAVTATSSSSINITWTDATGSPAPEFYLIVGRIVPSGTFVTVTDGPEIPADADWTDGNFAARVAHGSGGSLNVTGLQPETQYEFAIYPYRENSGNANYKTSPAPPLQSDFTFSAEPGGHSATFTATLSGTVNIDLAFNAANTIANADGYVIYRREGSAASLTGLNDGAAPPATLAGTTVRVTITNNTATTYTDVGLEGGKTYHYVLVPYNYDGTNDATYNYLTNGAEPRANATTTLIITLAQLTGGIAASPLNSGSTNQAILGFSVTTNGPVTFNALNVNVSSTPVGKFTSPRIFSSSNNVFDGSDTPVNTGTLTPSQVQFSSIGQSFTSAGTYFFFVVVNVSPSVNASTPSVQPAFNEANITFTSPAASAQPATITGTNYSFTDALPPEIVFNPSNGAVNFSAVGNITITFNEPVRKLDNSPVTSADIEGGLVELKLNNDAGAAVPFSGTINGTFTVITINPTSTLLPNQIYYVEINPVEDFNDNATASQSITFTTEDRPAIAAFSPAGGTCISDNVTVTGTRFTGTGNPVTGNSQPTVFVNGIAVPSGNISSYNATSVTFTVPTGVTTGPITVRNNDSDLISNASSNLNVFPAMNLGIPVTPATLSPAQYTTVDITISSTQDNNYTYSLIATSVPSGYSALTQSITGNNGTRTLTTDPALSEIGNYTYRIDVSRPNCTTRTLTNTPFTLTVAPLSVSVSATKTTICAGESIYLIASTNGGTGFVQFRWTSTPSGFSSNSSSPSVSPSSSIRYNLEVEDNAGNIATGFVDITVHPLPNAEIVPNPGETSVRTNYVIEDRDYLVTGSPAGGVFSGQGIRLKADGKYYFNPQSAGINISPGWPITYTFTDANGCRDTDTKNFIVQSVVVNGVSEIYCRNVTIDNDIQVNISQAIRPGFQFTRLRFYACYVGTCYYDAPLPSPILGTPPASGLPPGATYPLTLIARETTPVLDIQTGLPVFLPKTYALNLDHIRNGWGYGYYYLDVFAKDAFGNEYLQSWAFFRVVDNGPEPVITGIDENANICQNSPAITLNSSIPDYTIVNFATIPPAYNGALSGPSNRIFNPGHASFSGADERAIGISMTYNDLNNCPNTVYRNFNWIKQPEAPVGNNAEYCQVSGGTSTPFIISATPVGSATNARWFDRDPISNPGTAVLLEDISFTFAPPGITGTTPTLQTFYVTQMNKGCESGSATPVTIEIKPSPNAVFTLPSICDGEDFMINGPTDGPNPYEIYEWSFGDGRTAVVEDDNQVTYNYGPNKGNNSFVVELRVTNSRNCRNSHRSTALVGINPNPDFTADYICEGDLTQLSATVSNVQVDQFQWNFGDGTAIIGPADKNLPAPEGGTYQMPMHQFPSAGLFDVSVTAYSPIGCNATKTKPIRILKSLNVTSSYIMQDLDGGKGFWTVEDIAGNSTWEFNVPTTPLFSSFGNAAWVTKASGHYNPLERSYVNSPCITFTSVPQPVISLDYMFKTPAGVDGAVLEYSDNGGLTWQSLGSPGTGLNWFNTSGFILGNIGSSPVGWSDTTTVTSVRTGRHALDGISNKINTRFRLAFASSTGDKSRFEGFAFNNVKIESRNRNLLIENFTQNHSSFAANNTLFNNLTPTDGIKLQYHLPFPYNDQLFQENPSDFGARAAFYGITNSLGLIPRVYVDGYSQGNLTQAWSTNYRSLRGLSVSPVSLTITTLPRSSENALNFNVNLVTGPTGVTTGKPVLFVALIEKQKGGNQNVVRRMLPNAAGTLLTVPLTSQTITFQWIPDIPFNAAELAIVAFVQDEVTKEVLQATALLNPQADHLPDPIITSTENPFITSSVSLYPNPADDALHIIFSEPLRQPVAVTLTDLHGRNIMYTVMPAGKQTETINTGDLTAGMYILQVSGGQHTLRKKVIIAHER